MALMPDAAEPHSRPGDVYRSVDGFPDWLARSPAIRGQSVSLHAYR